MVEEKSAVMMNLVTMVRAVHFSSVSVSSHVFLFAFVFLFLFLLFSCRWKRWLQRQRRSWLWSRRRAKFPWWKRRSQ